MVKINIKVFRNCATNTKYINTICWFYSRLIFKLNKIRFSIKKTIRALKVNEIIWQGWNRILIKKYRWIIK